MPVFLCVHGEQEQLEPELFIHPSALDPLIEIRQPLQDATLVMRRNGLFILFDEPQRGITPGQFAVWYNDDEMIGSGVIGG